MLGCTDDAIRASQVSRMSVSTVFVYFFPQGDLVRSLGTREAPNMGMSGAFFGPTRVARTNE